MAITASDVLIKLSTKLGSAGNSLAQADVNLSLGKYTSTTTLTDNNLHNLFDLISGSENSSSTVDYRALFIRNNHGSLTMQGTKVYLSAEVSGGASIAIAIDDIAASAIGASSAQAAEITNETTAPSGVGSFSSPTTTGAALSLGDIPAGYCRCIWLKRTAANSAAKDNDGVTFSVFFDTSE